MTRLKWVGAALGLTVVCIQFIRPARTNPPTDSSRTVFARTPVPSRTAAVLERGLSGLPFERHSLAVVQPRRSRMHSEARLTPEDIEALCSWIAD